MENTFLDKIVDKLMKLDGNYNPAVLRMFLENNGFRRKNGREYFFKENGHEYSVHIKQENDFSKKYMKIMFACDGVRYTHPLEYKLN